MFSKITGDECLRRNRIVSSRLDSQLRALFFYSYQHTHTHTRMIIESSMTTTVRARALFNAGAQGFDFFRRYERMSKTLASVLIRIKCPPNTRSWPQYLSIKPVEGPPARKSVLPCAQANIDVDWHRLVVASDTCHTFLWSVLSPSRQRDHLTHVSSANEHDVSPCEDPFPTCRCADSEEVNCEPTWAMTLNDSRRALMKN